MKNTILNYYELKSTMGLERFENVALIPTIINIYRYRPNIKTMFYRAMSTYNTEIKEEY